MIYRANLDKILNHKFLFGIVRLPIVQGTPDFPILQPNTCSRTADPRRFHMWLFRIWKQIQVLIEIYSHFIH